MARLPEHLSAAPVGEPLAREVVLAGQRQRVVEAAGEVIAERGYHGATVGQIVAASGAAVGSFYGLFEGKEDCFLAAFDAAVEEARAEIGAALAGIDSFPEQVWAALRALLGLIVAEPRRARLVLIEAQSAGPAARERYDALLAELAPLLARGRDRRPEAAALPDSLEGSLLGGLSWLVRRNLGSGDLEPIGGLLPEMARLIFDPYLGESESERLTRAFAT
jgi:AcrR family transcriptional regulator